MIYCQKKKIVFYIQYISLRFIFILIVLFIELFLSIIIICCLSTRSVGKYSLSIYIKTNNWSKVFIICINVFIIDYHDIYIYIIEEIYLRKTLKYV